jgi:Leucine-rich repeat (LRR) protein
MMMTSSSSTNMSVTTMLLPLLLYCIVICGNPPMMMMVTAMPPIQPQQPTLQADTDALLTWPTLYTPLGWSKDVAKCVATTKDKNGVDIVVVDDGQHWTGVTCDEKLQRITELRVPSSSLLFAIPDTIDDLDALQTLDMHDNQLNSTLPSSLSAMPSLEVVDLSHNQLSGSITPFTAATMLRSLKLSNNRFSGAIDASKFPVDTDVSCNYLDTTTA